MALPLLQTSTNPHPDTILGVSERRTIARYLSDLTNFKRTRIQLREALAREDDLLREKEEFIRQQKVLNEESDHRLLNGLQMVSSLLSLQSRGTMNVEVASQLAVASARVGTIGRVHERLHSLDGVKNVAFKPYLEDFCRDFAAMAFAQPRPEDAIAVEAVDIELPTVTAIPLAFIANELLTNAVKYGKGRIVVRLEPSRGNGHAMSVVNDGPALPQGFDPAFSKGLGMKIIQSFVQRIRGELQFGCRDSNQGARFTVLFS